MTVYVGLLRAVNVGGTGRLPMADLKVMCEAAGFTNVETYIASGNVVFEARGAEGIVKTRLESRLQAYPGKAVDVFIRTAPEMAAVVAANPFPDAPANLTMAVFLDTAPPADTLAAITGQADEEVRLGKREIYIRYPQGQAATKLKVRAAGAGTARNMNTVAKLAAMASAR